MQRLIAGLLKARPEMRVAPATSPFRALDSDTRRYEAEIRELKKTIERQNALIKRRESDLRQSQARLGAVSTGLRAYLHSAAYLFVSKKRLLAGKPPYIAADMKPNATPYCWDITGGDPQLIFPIQTQSKYIRVQFTGQILSNSSRLIDGRWQIYFDYGHGYHEANSFSVWFSGPDILIDEIVRLDAPLFSLRLDPINRPCEMRIQNFRVQNRWRLFVICKYAFRRCYASASAGRLVDDATNLIRNIFQRDGLKALAYAFRGPALNTNLYESWCAQRMLDAQIKRKMKDRIASFALHPKFSIIMPTYNSRPEFLGKALASVVSQIYENWELCIADDGSKNTSEILAEIAKYKTGGRAIHVRMLASNVGISNASNAAAELATGDYIVLMDHDDEIAPHALFAFADAINRNPDADWLYSDEDKIGVDGRRRDPFFKPDWSPAYFLSCMFTCHLGAYRKTIFDRLGGFRPEFDFAQDYDLALRFASVTANVVHVPDMLYHWRLLPESTASGAAAKPIAEIRARAAVQAFIDRGAYPGVAEAGPCPGMHRPAFAIKGAPRVSIAIPSAGGRAPGDGVDSWYVLELVRSIRARTTYKNLEIVVADNDDFEPDLIRKLDPLIDRRVHYTSDVFNMSDKMNLVVSATRGDYVVILNDDMEVISNNWIEEMLMWAQQDDVAGVGAKLLFADRRVQHAGVLLLRQGPSHPYYLHDATDLGYGGNAAVAHELSAVTGACMMMRRQDYLELGGFDPAFRINYNDVDFCLRLTEKTGKRIVWTPYAELFHYESASKETPPEGELRAITERWAQAMSRDPFYNIHLSPSSNCYEMGPRIRSLEEDYNL